MKQGLVLEFEWLASGPLDSSTRAGLAALSIWVNGKPANELEDIFAKTVRRSMRVSAHDLAIWLAANWWRLRWEPQRESLSWKMSHQIGAAGGGYAWPSLSFVSDGEFVSVIGQPSTDWGGAPVRYLNSIDEIISAREFELGIDHYVEAVLERLTSCHNVDSALIDVWAAVCEERQNPEQSNERKLEALLGYDPDEASTSVIETLQGMATYLGRGAIEEIASASQNDAMDHVNMLLEHQNNAIPAVVPERDYLCQKISEIDRSQRPWQQGARSAALVRNAWGIHAGEPIANKKLCDLIDIPGKILSGEADIEYCPMAAGFRNCADRDGLKLILTKHPITGRRFELARLIGADLSAKTCETLLPVTNAKTTRQKFQRAFAQELLCPFVSLDEYFGGKIPDDDKIELAADHFHVSPLLVKTALVNRGRLPRYELAV
jgi:hypothetical protein